MGNFFTSTQIYNSDASDRSKFIDTFCKAMKTAGYVTCDIDEAEKSYILRFADNCKWVTITSEAYEDDNETALSDTSRIAKMLKTICINTNVLDSDCAVLEMYGASGENTDTLAIGRANDYFGDDIPQPSEKVWKPFLADESSCEKFCEIVEDSENYIFIEDGLSELAPLIGMDKKNILFNAYFVKEDEQTVFLNFKKAEVKKKITLNAALKQHFGEMLIPEGFTLLKSKYPYFVRVTDDGIIQSISFTTSKTPYLDCFELWVGHQLADSQLIDYNRKPSTFDNGHVMMPLKTLFRSCSLYLKDFEISEMRNSVCYEKGNETEMLKAIELSLNSQLSVILRFFNTSKTLDDNYSLGEELCASYKDIVVLKQKIDEYQITRKSVFERKIEELKKYAYRNPSELKTLESDIQKAIEIYNKYTKWFNDRKIGAPEYENYMKAFMEKKKENYELLKGLGII